MNRRVLRLALSALLIGSLSFLLLGCGFSDKLKINIGDSSTEISARVGEVLPMLKRPSKKGFSFAGWSQDGKAVDVERPLLSAVPLDAEFVPDTDATEGLRFTRFGKGLAVTGGGASEYATLTIPAYAAPFSDGVTLPVVRIDDSAFRNAKIGNLILPDTLTELGASCFENATLPHPYFPYALSKIEDRAFWGASGFFCFDCPERVVSIAPTAFAGLKIREFRSFSKKYVASDRALFCGTTLFSYPAGAAPRDYEAPDFVTTVGEYAFYGQTFGTLTLRNVERIEPHALENASSAELSVPSVKIVAEDAMRGFRTETLSFPASAASFGARSIESLRARRVVFRGLPSFRNAGNPDAILYAPAGAVETLSAIFPERFVADAALLEGSEPIVVDGVLIDCPDGITELSVGGEVAEIAASACGVPGLRTIEFRGAPPKFGANVFYGSSSLKIYVPERYLPDYRAACPAYADRFFPSDDETEPAPETVTFTLLDGANIKRLELPLHETFCLPGAERTGYRFAGWRCGDEVYPTGGEVSADGDKTFEAVFERIYFSVSFYADERLIKTESVPYGSAATAPDAPEKAPTAALEYCFDGWDTAFDRVERELVVRAVFRSYPRKYAVSFYADGVLLKRESVEYRSGATPPGDPVKAPTAEFEFVFHGWDADYTDVTEDRVITAVFSEIPRYYTVRFYADGALLKTESVRYGGAATPPGAPEKPSDPAFDYLFDGWSAEFSKIEGDLDVTADFRAVARSYSVRFWADGTLLKTETVPYGGAAAAPETAPRKPADAAFEYAFIGWNAGFDKIERDTDVAAVFREIPRYYTVSFYSEGALLSEVSVAYGKSASAPEPPAKPSDAEFDYAFAGWDRDFGAVTEDLAVCAVFRAERRSYAVVFLADGGEIARQTVAYGEAATAPAPPGKDSDAEFDYVFDGWDGAFDRVTGSLEIRAVYRKERRSYAVTLSAEGAILETRNILYGDPIGVLPETYRDRRIARFEDAEGTKYTGAEAVTGPLELFAVLESPPRDPYAGTEGLEFSYDPDLNGYTVEYYFGDAADVEIPSRYRGGDGDLPVVAIGRSVFDGKALRSVVFPDTLVKIGDRAFCSVTGLSELTLPESLLEIGNYAFYGAEGLREIVLPASVRKIGNDAFPENADFRLVLTGGAVEEFGFFERDLRVAVPEAFLSLYRERFRDRPELLFTALPADVSKK